MTPSPTSRPPSGSDARLSARDREILRDVVRAYIVRGDTAERVPIATGAASVREVATTGGLADGDRIVISDTDDFKDAARVLLAD